MTTQQRTNQSLGCQLGALLLVVVCLPVMASAEKYFRYRNHAGLTIIDSRMPPEYVKYGYDIINEHGQALETIAPQATDAQLAVHRKREEEHRKLLEQQKSDERLLMRYSNTADIRAAELRVTDEIGMRVSILRSNIRSLRRQMERQRETAANTERAGREVPQKLLDNISGMESEIEGLLGKIAVRKKEIVEQQEKFQQEVARFEYLQDRRYGRTNSSDDESSAASKDSAELTAETSE